MTGPDGNETRVVWHESKHRSCKDQHCVTHRNDFIEAVWCIETIPGHPDRRFPAEVLHITLSPEQDRLATGVILYLPGHTWDEETHRVEFLNNYKLRLCTEHNGGTPQCEENNNLLVDWKYSDNCGDSSARIDQDWTPKSTGEKGRVTEVHSSHSTIHEVEIAAVRSGQAALAVRVQMLQREVMRLSRGISALQNYKILWKICTGAGSVILRFWHRLALRIQAGLRAVQSTTGKRSLEDSEQNLMLRTGDGLHVGALKVRVECTLLQLDVGKADTGNFIP